MNIEFEKQIVENLSRAGQRMMGFAKSTFFKRIDSSGFSFLLTLYRHILRNMVFIYALDNKLKLPIGDEIIVPTDEEHYKNKAKEYYEIITLKNNLSWIDGKYFKRTLKKILKKDCEVLFKMMKLCGNWIPSTDQKLNELQSLICNTHKDEKIVVFTQYSDTAEYIERQLRKRKVQQVCVVTGDTKNTTEMVEKFSPISNDKLDMPIDEQYRVVIATDVLSEGQNL